MFVPFVIHFYAENFHKTMLRDFSLGKTKTLTLSTLRV